MDLDALLFHYFGTTDIDTLAPAALDEACERVAVALGTERDPGRRFALWALLHALGQAPDPAVTFKDAQERTAAQDYAWEAGKIADRE